MASVEPGPRRSLSRLDAARVLFLVAALAFGWWGLRARGAEIVEALGHTSPLRVLAALVLVVGGLGITAGVWRRILAGYGHPVPRREAAAIFFIGQLGKYIPGSVWSLGAQADMARRHSVPARTTVAVGLLFLWANVFSALIVGVPLLDPSGWGWLGAAVLRVAAVVAAVVALSPPVLARVGDLLARATEPLRLSWVDCAGFVVQMAAVWALYGLALVLVIPPPTLTSSGGMGAVLGHAIAAFAVSYVVGVVIILAPAGVGAREAALIALLSPALGVPAAAAAALMIRVVHTVADFTLAGTAWWVRRWGGRVVGSDAADGFPESA